MARMGPRSRTELGLARASPTPAGQSARLWMAFGDIGQPVLRLAILQADYREE